MIILTRLQGQSVVVNADLIEFVEETPDTLVTLNTGKKILVRERAAEVVRRVVEYKSRCVKPQRKRFERRVQ